MKRIIFLLILIAFITPFIYLEIQKEEVILQNNNVDNKKITENNVEKDNKENLNKNKVIENNEQDTCGNNVCDFLENSNNCETDCPKAKISKDKWTQVNGPYGGPLTSLKKLKESLLTTVSMSQGVGTDTIYEVKEKGTIWEGLGGSKRSSDNLVVKDEDTFAFVSEGDLFITRDHGHTYDIADLPHSVSTVAFGEEKMYAGLQDGRETFLYVSNDDGITWKKVSALPKTEWSVEPIWQGFEDSQSHPQVIVELKNNIFIGTFSALIKSSNNGLTWERIDSSFHRTDVKDIVVEDDEIYVRVGVFEDFKCMDSPNHEFDMNNCASVYKSSDMGETWEQLDVAFADPSEGSLYVDDYNPDIAYVVFSRKIFRTTDGGKSWTQFFNTHDIPEVPNVGVESLVVGENSDELYIAGFQGLWRSDDFGEHWHPRNKGFIGSEVVDIVKSKDGTIYAGTYTLGMFKSTDNGQSWSFASYGLENPYVMSIAVNSENVYVTTNGGIYISKDKAKTWQPVGIESFEQSGHWKDIAHFHGIDIDGDRIYVGGGGDQYTPKGSGIFISEDNGQTWTNSNEGFETDVHVSKILVSPYDSSIVYATTQGATEFQEKTGKGHGVFISKDYGKSWKKINKGLETLEANTISIDPNNKNVLYLGTDDDGLYKSVNSGDTWGKVDIPGLPSSYGVGDIIIDNDKVFVGIVDYFRLSHDRGYLGDYGVYVSYNNGNTFEEFNEGLEHKGAYKMLLDENKLYVGTRRGGIYWRSV